MLLLTGVLPLPFDIYILRFPEGSEIPEHVNKIKTEKHFRLNIILKNASSGGVFECENSIWETNRIKLFRSDVSNHSVSRIASGPRYLLSIGWIKNN